VPTSVRMIFTDLAKAAYPVPNSEDETV